MADQPMLFASFEPGRTIGSVNCAIDAGMLDLCRKVYGLAPPADGKAPSALALPLLMRSYMQVITPRPPGNVQVRGAITVADMPRVGEAVRTEFRCAHKELRNERRYLDLAATATGADGRELFSADMKMIWAA